MQLTRSIIFFDLETTGVSTSSDRIVQIGAIKFLVDGTSEEKDVLINPLLVWKAYCKSCAFRDCCFV